MRNTSRRHFAALVNSVEGGVRTALPAGMMAVSVVPTSEAYSVDGAMHSSNCATGCWPTHCPATDTWVTADPRRERALASLARGAALQLAIDYFDRIAAGNDRPR